MYDKVIDLKAILLKICDKKVKRMYEFVTAGPCLGMKKKRKHLCVGYKVKTSDS